MHTEGCSEIKQIKAISVRRWWWSHTRDLPRRTGHHSRLSIVDPPVNHWR